MSSQLDFDAIPKMEAAQNEIAEMSNVIRKASEELLEICKDTGIPKLIKTAENALASSEEMAKCSDEVAESLEKSVSFMKKEAAAYGL